MSSLDLEIEPKFDELPTKAEVIRALHGLQVTRINAEGLELLGIIPPNSGQWWIVLLLRCKAIRRIPASELSRAHLSAPYDVRQKDKSFVKQTVVRSRALEPTHHPYDAIESSHHVNAEWCAYVKKHWNVSWKRWLWFYLASRGRPFFSRELGKVSQAHIPFARSVRFVAIALEVLENECNFLRRTHVSNTADDLAVEWYDSRIPTEWQAILHQLSRGFKQHRSPNLVFNPQVNHLSCDWWKLVERYMNIELESVGTGSRMGRWAFLVTGGMPVGSKELLCAALEWGPPWATRKVVSAAILACEKRGCVNLITTHAQSLITWNNLHVPPEFRNDLSALIEIWHKK